MANMTRYEPTRNLVPLSDAINQLFSDSFAFPRFTGRNFGPVANSNLYETKDGYILQVALPGATSDDVEITVHDDVLTLKAKTQLPTPEGARALWSGLGATEFHHSFSLPAAINAEAANADFANGILTLTLPKAEHVKPRTIKVNGAVSTAE